MGITESQNAFGFMRFYLGLVHYPVYNKKYEEIASAVTTVDIHDLSRLARTYGVKQVFIITPLVDQQRLVQRVCKHWTEGYGATYNPHRREAIELVSISSSIEEAVSRIEKWEHARPIVMATDASRPAGRSISYDLAGRMLANGELIFLLFGTAWGLVRETLEKADYVLDPVWGGTDYNHLSVRTAAAIIIDRMADRIQIELKE